MVSSLTTNRGLMLPVVGGDVGSWGTELNVNTFTVLDSVLGSVVQFNSSNGTSYTLTQAQAQNNHIVVVSCGSNVTLTLQGSSYGIGSYNVSNFSTMAAGNVTIQTTAGGQTVTVPPSWTPAGYTITNIYADGVSIWGPPRDAEVLLQTFTLAGTSAAIDPISLASTSYSAIKVIWQGVTPTTDAVASLFMQLGTSSTVFVTGAAYSYVNAYTLTGTGAAMTFVTSSNAGGMGLSAGPIRSTAAIPGVGNSGMFVLNNYSNVPPAGGFYYPTLHGTGIGVSASVYPYFLGGAVLSNPPFTSIRFFLSSAPASPSQNFANGSIRIYGVV